MKKILLILVMILSLITLTACNKSDAVKFKNYYEEINNQGIEGSESKYRSIEISSKNPMVYSTFEEVNERIDNKETFIIYVGFRMCPWCRSVVETSINKAIEYGIKDIYYIDVRPDDERSGDLRGYKKLNENNEVIIDVKSSDAYQEFIKTADEYLDPYVLTDENGNEYQTGEDRLYAPTFLIVNKGKIDKVTSGISDTQKDPFQELDDTTKNDMNKLFDEFYKHYNSVK